MGSAPRELNYALPGSVILSQFGVAGKAAGVS
jgi:hypothetical protein